MPHPAPHLHSPPPLFASRLKKAQISLTPSRLAILTLLSESHRVWSIEQIILGLKKLPKKSRGSTVFTTIYRCLLKMEAAKLVRRADLGDGVSRYEYDSGDLEHHHHVVCRKCEEVRALDHCQVLALEKTLEHLGYEKIEHRLEFSAVCKNCS